MARMVLDLKPDGYTSGLFFGLTDLRINVLMNCAHVTEFVNSLIHPLHHSGENQHRKDQQSVKRNFFRIPELLQRFRKIDQEEQLNER